MFGREQIGCLGKQVARGRFPPREVIRGPQPVSLPWELGAA